MLTGMPGLSCVIIGSAYPCTTFPPIPSVTVILTLGLTKAAVQVTRPLAGSTIIPEGPLDSTKFRVPPEEFVAVTGYRYRSLALVWIKSGLLVIVGFLPGWRSGGMS